MAGAQSWHVRVTANLSGMLYNRLRSRGCEFFNSDMRVRVKAGDLWTYPDLSALCGEAKLETAGNLQSLVNPPVIFEVPSPSKEVFDKGDKFRRYRLLESLTDYVLVSNDRWKVKHHHVQENGVWVCDEYTHPASVFRLASLDCDLPLAEVYEDVAFPEDS